MATSTFDKKIVIKEKAADKIIDQIKKPTHISEEKVNEVRADLKRSKNKLKKLSLH